MEEVMSAGPAKCSDVGVVAIGRNEGDRLRQCLESVVKDVAAVVYVDSGSTDDSVALAQSLGVDVVNLDFDTPFTAARARNAGLDRLLESHPDLTFVQFVDGDCEVASGWLETAREALLAESTVAVVCGRRRERFRSNSVYNRLCDIEWDTPVGEATACGGDAMMRVEAFRQVRGFHPRMIAGEEPELCFRFRREGRLILRLDAEMTLHDAAMVCFSQWWKRSVRAGHAYAEGSWLHGRSPERYWVRETRSLLCWGFVLPLLMVVLAWPSAGLSLSALLLYPLLMLRVYRHMRQRRLVSSDAALYAFFCVLGKFPQALGAYRFYTARRSGKANPIIEYK